MYPLFAAVGVAVGICGFQLVRNICINPEVRSLSFFLPSFLKLLYWNCKFFTLNFFFGLKLLDVVACDLWNYWVFIVLLFWWDGFKLLAIGGFINFLLVNLILWNYPSDFCFQNWLNLGRGLWWHIPYYFCHLIEGSNDGWRKKGGGDWGEAVKILPWLV